MAETTETTKKSRIGHTITMATEQDDNGEDHLVVRCDACGYAQTVPGASEAVAQQMAIDHSR